MPELNKRSKSFLGLALVLSALAGASPVFASTITVTNTNTSGPGSFVDALANAAYGDTINFSVTGTIVLLGTQVISNKNLTISGNSAATSGSGITITGFNVQLFIISQLARVTFSNLTLQGGYNPYGNGGAFDNKGTLTIVNSTLARNGAYGGCGGAIYNEGTLTVINSTFSLNGAGPSGGACNPVSGGAIANFGSAFISNSTFAGNGAFTVNPQTGLQTYFGTEGGAISNDSQKGGSLTIKTSLLAGNSAGEGNNCYSDDPIVSLGYNLLQPGDLSPYVDPPNACFSSLAATDITNVTDAGIDPRNAENNGGPMQTVALFPGSQAIDAIPAASCTDINGNPVTADQRGIARPQGAGCDIGAYELVSVPALSNLGTIQAWGENAQGELGNGTTANSNTPVPVSALSGVAAIAAGGSGVAALDRFSLALLSNGTAWAWGNNQDGQLGNGTTTNSSTPSAVSALSGVTAIAAGAGHALALLNNGTIWAWGNNADGQLAAPHRRPAARPCR